MTTPRPGDAFDVDLGGTVITGRYVEVDPPHRLVIEWDHQQADTATSTPALVEITLTPAGEVTTVEVQFAGLSPQDAAFHRRLWQGHLGRIATALAGAERSE